MLVEGDETRIGSIRKRNGPGAGENLGKRGQVLRKPVREEKGKEESSWGRWKSSWE